MREMTPAERRAAEKEAVEKSALSDAQELTNVTDVDRRTDFHRIIFLNYIKFFLEL